MNDETSRPYRFSGGLPIKIPRRTRRDEILEYIKNYAFEKSGPTPTIREIAKHFDLAYTTVYAHIRLLLREGRIKRVDGKIVIPGSRWIAPDEED